MKIKTIDCFIVLFGACFICCNILLLINIYTITTELIFDHNIFYKEDNGWGIKHHITKFIFMFEFGSMPYFYVNSKKASKKIITLAVIGGISLCTFFFLIGEVIEEGNRLIINKIFTSNWFTEYSSETVADVILSDGIQSILTGIGAHCFIIYFSLKSPSSLLVNLNYKMIIFRFLIYLIFAASGFLGTLDKEFGGEVFKVGYYAEFFLRLFILGILQRIIIIDSRDIDLSYCVIYMYYMLISMPLILNVRYWDLFVSNGTMIVLFGFLVLIKIKIKQI